MRNQDIRWIQRFASYNKAFGQLSGFIEKEELDDLLLPDAFDPSIYKQIANEALTDHIERVGIVFYERTSSLNSE